MSSSVQKHFAHIAHAYDRANRILSLGRDHAWRQRMIGAVAAARAPRVLDLCAGTLECTLALLERFPDARVTAIDFSREMLALGVEKLPARVRPQVETVCVDAAEVDFPASSFDVVLCAWGMRNLTDKARAARKVRSWLAPSGQFLVLDFFRPTRLAERALFSIAGVWLIPLVGGAVTGDCAAYRYLVRSIREGQCVDEFAGFLGQNGFHIRRIARLSPGPCALVIAQAPG